MGKIAKALETERYFFLFAHVAIVVLVCFILSLPRVVNFKVSPAASPEILHHTVWRTWLGATSGQWPWCDFC